MVQERVSPESEPGLLALGDVVGTSRRSSFEPSIHRIHIFRDHLPRLNLNLSRQKKTTAWDVSEGQPYGRWQLIIC